jgi:hypothetical protein
VEHWKVAAAAGKADAEGLKEATEECLRQMTSAEELSYLLKALSVTIVPGTDQLLVMLVGWR